VRIALVSPPWIPVPPTGYGGIEWVVSLLADGLVERGHDVTLFATGDSHTKAELRYVFDVGPVERMHRAMPYAMHVGAAYQHVAAEARAGRPYDVVGDHTAWLSLAFAPLIPTPVVHTLHGSWLEEERALFRQCRDHARFVSVSMYQTTTFQEIEISDVIPNAVDVGSYEFRARKDGYLLSMGRVTRDKGQGLAIDVAKRAGMPLLMAGKVDPGDDAMYFDEAVLPHLDGENVQFLGEVSEERKRELFAGASALLFPVQWDEPFGLVMIEAMASGTPVIATPYGAVPEVVADGETGYVVKTVDEMVEAVARLERIDPARCRAEVERRFSPGVMVEGYEAVFRRLAAG
jgi:glycosyltransferase involved in cell wall biosynthesis